MIATTPNFVVFESVETPSTVLINLPLLDKPMDISDWAESITPSGSTIAKSNLPRMIDSRTVEVMANLPASRQEATTRESKNNTNYNVDISFELLIKEENLPIKINSGYRGKNGFRGGKTVQGKTSNHSRLDSNGNPMAYDIVPKEGYTFDDLRKIIYKNPRVVLWFKSRGWGVLEEMQNGKRGFYDINGGFHYTGATGPHFHIGPDTYGVLNYNHKISMALQGMKFNVSALPFTTFTSVETPKVEINLPVLEKTLDISDWADGITLSGNIIAKSNLPRMIDNLQVTRISPQLELLTIELQSVEQTSTGQPKTSITGDKKRAIEFFLKKGLSNYIAAGIVGNLIVESDGLKTGARGDGGKALGLAQWHPDRQRGLRTLAQSRGTDITDFNTQLEYIWLELNSTEKKALDKLISSRNVEEATVAFMKYYERPGTPHTERRINEARALLN